MGFRYRAKKLIRKGVKAAKKRYGGKGGIVRLAKDVSWLKGQLNTELKYRDSTQTAATNIPSVTSASRWLLYRLNGMGVGTTGVADRVGTSVKIKSLHIKGNLERLAGNHRIRMVLFIDKEPGIVGIGNNTTYDSVYNTTSIDAMRNWNSVLEKRYTVLYDRTWVADADDLQKPFNIYKKMNMTVKWQPGDFNPEAINQNVLYLAFMTDDPAGTSCQATFHHRITYVDN